METITHSHNSNIDGLAVLFEFLVLWEKLKIHAIDVLSAFLKAPLSKTG